MDKRIQLGEREEMKIVPPWPIINNRISSIRRQSLMEEFDLKEHQIEALKLTAQKQNYPVYEIFGDVIAILSSGLFDTETVIHDFTRDHDVRLVNGLYYIEITKRIDDQKDTIVLENGLKIGLPKLDQKKAPR